MRPLALATLALLASPYRVGCDCVNVTMPASHDDGGVDDDGGAPQPDAGLDDAGIDAGFDAGFDAGPQLLPPPITFAQWPRNISSLRKAALPLSGRCFVAGGEVALSGGAALTTTCDGGGWTALADFSTAPDGLVTVTGVQLSVGHTLASAPTSHFLFKRTALCDSPDAAGQLPFAGGTGTPTDPFLICVAPQLANLSIALDASVRLANDIELGDSSWAPLGTFIGAFDGQDYVVLGLGGSYGLFDLVDGTIANLGVEGVDITGVGHLGALVDTLTATGVVSSCHSTGRISGVDVHVGGLVGSNYGTITGSWSSARVDGPFATGGLVGHNYYLVAGSWASGDVSGTYGVGGLIGRNDLDVVDSFATGRVDGAPDAAYVGGLVGEHQGTATITRCYSLGAVDGGDAWPLAGDRGGTVTASYWNVDTSGFPASTPGALGTGVTSAAMRDAGTFAGWNFNLVWTYDPAVSLFPVLRPPSS